MGELAALLVSQGVSVASNASNTYANAQAARGQQAYANSQTNINTGWSEIQQNQVLSRGDIAGSRASAGYERLAGTQRAAFAGSGVNVNAGSAAAIQGETRALGEIERLELQRQAYSQALGIRAENSAAVSQNRMRQIAMRNAVNQSYAAAAIDAGQTGIRSAYYAERYQGLGKKKDQGFTSEDEERGG